MNQPFPNGTIDDLKCQLNIVDVIGSVVPLKRAGTNYKGVCPFHNEKTPSFVVSEQKQIFTCFGCGASGDAIEFTKRYYRLEFSEAIEKLAKENGISITQVKGNQDKEKYYEINKMAARFFYNNLTMHANPGYSYMKKRGIEDEILKKFGIGYADEQWDSLYQYFKNKGIEEKLLLELGLISESKGKYYDKFRNRVMFPIINTSGKVIGFGGRALGEDMPKYLNSPENKVFQKKNNLYALNTTKTEIGKEGYAVLVEGYMDVISLYQHGVRNVSASLGTALTGNQAKLIHRYTGNVVLSYDADEAGRKAAMRGLEILNAENCKVKVLHVTDGKDPDEYIKNHGRDAFLMLVQKALPMIEYKLQNAQVGLDLSTEEGKLDYMKNASNLLKNLSPVETDIYTKKLARELRISEEAIRMELLGTSKKESHYVPKERNITNLRENVEQLSQLEATMIKIVLNHPEIVEKLLGKEGIMDSLLSKKILNLAFELYGLNGNYYQAEILDRLDPTESQIVMSAIEKIILAGNEEMVFEDCLKKWERQQLLAKEQELISRISMADEDSNEDGIKELTLELMKVQTCIR